MEVDLIWYVLTLCAAGSIAGLTAGLFGNGGGFVVVPALLVVFPFFTNSPESLMKVAVGTSLASIVISSARSVQAHHERGAVDFTVLKSWAIWLVAGVACGLWIATVASGDRLMLVFAIGVLFYAFYFLFPDLFVSNNLSVAMPSGAKKATLASFLGGFSALLGIGGGTITVITMVMCKRTIQQSVATAAGVGFIIGLPGAIGFMLMNHHNENLPFGTIGYINFPALLAISIGSILTAPFGAALAHKFSDKMLKRLFGIYLILVSITMYSKTL